MKENNRRSEVIVLHLPGQFLWFAQYSIVFYSIKVLPSLSFLASLLQVKFYKHFWKQSFFFSHYSIVISKCLLSRSLCISEMENEEQVKFNKLLHVPWYVLWWKFAYIFVPVWFMLALYTKSTANQNANCLKVWCIPRDDNIIIFSWVLYKTKILSGHM